MTSLEPRTARRETVRRLAILLARYHSPRLALFAIFTIAGGVAALTSTVLLQLDLTSMVVRYPVAAVAGYAAFLVGVRLWVLRVEGERPRDRRSVFDSLDPGVPDGSGLPAPDLELFGGGGEFSGGGAGGSFDSSSAADVAGGPDLPDTGIDGDELVALVVPVLVAGFLIAGLAGVLGIIWNAPALLAEALLDSAITTVAYRALRDVPTRDWINGVWRRTWKSMVAVTMLVAAIGYFAQRLVPGADSIGDFFPR